MTADILIIAALCAVWGAAGFIVCSVTHKQRGLETERVGVPDFVPPNWGTATEPTTARTDNFTRSLDNTMAAYPADRTPVH